MQPPKLEPGKDGELIESLQLQAVTLTVKALVASHPDPQALNRQMRHLFSQFQAAPIYYHLPLEDREAMKGLFEALLASLPDTT